MKKIQARNSPVWKVLIEGELMKPPCCRHHLALPSEADLHFRAVCRALVTEAVELSSFMEKVSSTASNVEVDSELGQLDIQDWVSLYDTRRMRRREKLSLAQHCILKFTLITAES